MKYLKLLLASLLLSGNFLFAELEVRSLMSNAKVAIKGYDVVAYQTKKKAIRGQKDYTVKYKDIKKSKKYIPAY